MAVTPHRLRHTLATRLISQGMSLEMLRKLLGHKTLRMTQRYAHLHDYTVQGQFQALWLTLKASLSVTGLSKCVNRET